MAFGHAIEQRLKALYEAKAKIPEILYESQKAAITKAVEVATEMTPPNEHSGPHGVNAITGESKAGWATDSVTEPIVDKDAKSLTVVLANNKQSISFLNNGFVVDQHFVPGLIPNPYTGLLDKLEPEAGGIVVGTQTKYVRGLYMRETALANYRGTLERELIKALKEVHDG